MHTRLLTVFARLSFWFLLKCPCMRSTAGANDCRCDGAGVV
jgi:hypothetical protein